MAKKTATKKKAAPSKAAAKKLKPVKAVKSAKVAVKPAPKLAPKAATKPAKPAAKPEAKASLKEVAKEAKPSLMTKKGKAAKVVADPVEIKKSETIVSLLESNGDAGELSKVEKTSKVKPVKVDRGNVNDEKAKWIELNKKYGKEKALNYKMTETYPSLVPLQHKVLGWGFVLTNENDRLEVLFENGIRMLISNYKS
jgi:hypothetical protein